MTLLWEPPAAAAAYLPTVLGQLFVLCPPFSRGPKEMVDFPVLSEFYSLLGCSGAVHTPYVQN